MLVHFYATLRSMIGQREVEILLPDGAPVRQLVSEIVTQYPALRQEMIDQEWQLAESYSHFRQRPRYHPSGKSNRHPAVTPGM